MLTRIISFSIKNKLIIGLFILALIGYGSYELTRLPVDAVPDITNNQVQVITVSPALGAVDIERLVTFPIEQACSNIPGLKELRSFSRFGLSVVTVVFADDVDVYWARQQISERLQQVREQIPQGFGTPTLGPVTTGLGEIYQYVVRPEKGYEHKYTAIELRTIQDWIIRRQLLGVPGVAEVSSFGGLLKQYEIAVDPARLMAHNLTIRDLFSALELNNQNIGGSYIEKGPSVLYIRSEGLVQDMDDIRNIVVRTLPDGTPLLIRDVADVTTGHATRYGALTYNGEMQVSGAIVLMLKGANSNEVIRRVRDRIAEIQQRLPEGVVIEPFLDRTKMVNNAIGTVSKNLVEGALIVVFVLVLFLGNLRAGLLVASVIPLSMLFAIIMMNTFGVSGNLMSLGALDFGLIVDGAVIIVEAVMHRLSHNRRYATIARLGRKDMNAEVQSAASRMMNSAVFGQVIILMVYLPIFSLQGIEGKMFRPMAQTVAFALAGAFILSLTYIPMMSSLVLSRNTKHKQTLSDRMMQGLEQFYLRGLKKAFRWRKGILGAALTLFLISLFMLSRLGGEFIPSLPEGDYAVETRVLTGSNIETSIDAVSQASRILMERFPEVEKVVTKTGTSEVPAEPLPIDVSDMIVVLKNRKEWTSAKTYEALEAKMSAALQEIPGVTFGFQYPVAMRFNELISGARQDVVCKIFGENMDTLAHYAAALGHISQTVEGCTGLYVEQVTGMPQIVIRYRRAEIAQYGLNIRDINQIVNAAFAGQTAGLVYEDEKRFDLVVRLAGERRKDLADVQLLLIPTPTGMQIPLQTVADVEITDGYNQIQREQSQRRIMVGFNVRGRDIQSTVQELQQKVATQVKLPPGYYITYGGAFENLNAAKARLYLAVPLALAMIFLMLYFAFRSVRYGLLIYTTIPLSATGGIWALVIRGMPFSISAGVGFIALFGICVLNGIILISEFNRLQNQGFSNVKRVVFMGGLTRLRPVMMTALVASLGFLPMALSAGEGAEVQRPLATVVIGGLLVATCLTLFVLPMLYTDFHKKNPLPKKAAVLPLLACGLLLNAPGSVKAQTPITLRAAIDTALRNNLSVKNQHLRAEYQRRLAASTTAIAPTDFIVERGQINSYYTDTRVGVSQAISFPTVYTAQKKLLLEEWNLSLLQAANSEADLKKQVSRTYYSLLYLEEKKRLLSLADSIYSSFLEKVRLRFETGESNILEKITAENQRGQVRLQSDQLKQDLALVQLQFQLLLNTETLFVPADDAASPPGAAVADAPLTAHPAMKFNQKLQDKAHALRRAEQSRLLPDFSLGYNIMGMKGTGADEKVYDDRLRFQSVQLGLSLPFIPVAQRARIRAARLQETIAGQEYTAALRSFENEFRSALAIYQKFVIAVQYYETEGLHNAENIAHTAERQFLNGAINYLEWTLLLNQSMTIRNEYIDAVRNRNLALADLNYFFEQ